MNKNTEHRYIVVDEPIKGSGDIFEKVCETAEQANAEAQRQWDHLTSYGQKNCHIYAGIVTRDDLCDWAFDEDTGEIDWTAYHSLDCFEGCFDSEVKCETLRDFASKFSAVVSSGNEARIENYNDKTPFLNVRFDSTARYSEVKAMYPAAAAVIESAEDEDALADDDKVEIYSVISIPEDHIYTEHGTPVLIFVPENWY